MGNTALQSLRPACTGLGDVINGVVTSAQRTMTSDDVTAAVMTGPATELGRDGNATVEGGDAPSLARVFVIGTFVSVVIVAIVVGNAFVVASVAAFREMRTLTNWMIVSLASADLLVAVAVLPLSAYQEVVGGEWRLGRALCDFWTTADVFCCTASILNIAAIALDRYWLITRNVAYTHAHRLPRRRACRLMAVSAWISAAVISVAPLLGWRTGQENNPDEGNCQISQDYAYTIFSTFGAFWLPLAVIIVVYGRIFWIAQRRLHRRIRQRLTALPPLQVPMSAACQSPLPTPTRRRRRSPGVDQSSPDVADDGPKLGGGARSTPLVLLSVPGLQTTATADEAAVCRVSPPSSGVATAAKPETEFLQVPSTSRAAPSDVVAVSSVGGGLGSTSTSTPPHARSRIDVVSNHLVSYRKCQYRRMRNSARMLGLIIGAFVLCWLPFFILATAVPFCVDACSVPAPVASVCLWLGYSNSLLNPVIYAIWDRNFRRCFRRLAKCDLRPRSGGIAASAAARGLPGAAMALRRSEPF